MDLSAGVAQSNDPIPCPGGRIRSTARLVWFVCLAGGVALVAGCTREDVGVGCEALAGDLVISEIMPNPVDDDAGQEWFEVYNASTVDQILDRIVIQRLAGTAADATVVAAHSVRDAPGPLGPAEYMVLGDGRAGMAPAYYQYGAAWDNEDLGALNNTAGGLRLLCKGSVIDEVWYGAGPEVDEGRSVALDGGVPPDALQNDKAELWCTSVTRYDGVNAGTPGEENLPCGLAACEENGTSRDVLPPRIGDLVITEVLADPDGADEGRDWIELHVAAAEAVDLNGLTVVATSGSGSERTAQLLSLDCVTAEPGDDVVISGSRDPSGNGMLVPDAVAEAMDLYAAGGAVSLLIGPVVLDTAPVVESREGKSVALDASVSLTPEANDEGALWCFGAELYDTANSGSPGAPNPRCSVAECLDGGDPRPTVWPGPGDLLITELLDDPAGSDVGREWVEVLVTAAAPIDLNGLIISKSGIAMALDASCVSVQPGETITIAASTDLLPSARIKAPDLLMSSAAGSVELRRGRVLIDSAAIPRSAPHRALALDAAVTTDAGNDDAGHWCYADQVYDASGNQGSPGVANRGCGVSQCGVGSGRPGQGDLLITEVFSNPSGVEEDKAWVELLVTAAGDVDLDGLILTKSGNVAMTLGSGCSTVQPGEVVVLGASGDPLRNGYVDVAIEAAGWRSSSSAGTIQLYRGDLLVDAATVPQSLDGVSLSLDPVRIASADNDTADAFCKSRTTGVFDGQGTPGLENELCTTGCSDGAQIRDPVPPFPGDLVITEVYANPTSTDDARDWLEVYGAGAGPVDLNGVSVEVQGSGSPVRWTLDSLDCLTVVPSAYVVIGGVNAAADGVVARATFGEEGDALLLGTVPARLALLVGEPATAIPVDEVDYAVPTSGVSASLDPSILDAIGNDTGTNWCAAPADHPPFAGTGSPGEANDACP